MHDGRPFWGCPGSPPGRISNLITAVCKVNRQDKTRRACIDDEADHLLHMSTIPEDEPITVAKLLWLVVHFDLVTVDGAQGAAIRSLHGHILIVVGNYAGNTYA